jgi:hypothetical protein
MKTQLLVETLTHDESNMITESSSDGKNLFVSGIMLQAEKRNRNGRIYPLSEMTRVVGQLQETLKNSNGFFGTLDHEPSLSVSSDRISHVITELRMEGNDVYGKAKILSTPMGQIAKVLIEESGVKMGMSSRGSGTLSPDGVVSDLNIICIDLVSTPSCSSAYVSGIYEALDDSIKGRHILTLAEQIQEDATAQKYLVTELKQWMSNLTKK